MIPEDDGEENDSELEDTVVHSFSTKQLVQDISREIKKTFREEISQLEASLGFVSDQLSAIEETVRKQNH